MRNYKLIAATIVAMGAAVLVAPCAANAWSFGFGYGAPYYAQPTCPQTYFDPYSNSYVVVPCTYPNYGYWGGYGGYRGYSGYRGGHGFHGGGGGGHGGHHR